MVYFFLENFNGMIDCISFCKKVVTRQYDLYFSMQFLTVWFRQILKLGDLKDLHLLIRLATATIAALTLHWPFRISALKLHCCVVIRLHVCGSGMIYQSEIIWRGCMIVIYFPDGFSIKLTMGIEQGHKDVIKLKVSILSFKISAI